MERLQTTLLRTSVIKKIQKLAGMQGQHSWRDRGITGISGEAGKKGDTWGSHVLEWANGGGLQRISF